MSQVVAYAEAKNTNLALLAYPRPLERFWNGIIGSKRVQTMVFDVERELEPAGEEFLQNLLRLVEGCKG